MAKAKLGSGARFAALKKKIAAKGGVRNPAAVAAAIGRKKYGAKKMAKMAAAGKHRHGISSHNSPIEFTPSDRQRAFIETNYPEYGFMDALPQGFDLPMGVDNDAVEPPAHETKEIVNAPIPPNDG